MQISPIYFHQPSPIIEGKSSQTAPATIKIHGHLERHVCGEESYQSALVPDKQTLYCQTEKTAEEKLWRNEHFSVSGSKRSTFI